MKLEHLFPAVDRLMATGPAPGSKDASFLRAYPALVAAAAADDREPEAAFMRTVSMAYGWLPQALRLDETFLPGAVDALFHARELAVTISDEVVDPIAATLGSVEGASLVLHLTNPTAFPIWGPEVEGFRIGEAPSAYHMAQSRNYIGFVEEVWTLTSDPYFLGFHQDYCIAYQDRLRRLHIRPYPLTEARVIQSATAELAGG